MPDSDRVSLIRWRSVKTDPPDPSLGRVLVIPSDMARDDRMDTDTAGLVVATPQYYDWWAPLPADQGLTVGDLLELAQAGGAGWAAITGPNAASKLRAALEQP